uniref:Family with sequence similarity 71 member F2 n=1 Tax=Chrysemys picta bellii TaxID=8478 RepID=A0A8C3P988_CHRPI
MWEPALCPSLLSPPPSCCPCPGPLRPSNGVGFPGFASLEGIGWAKSQQEEAEKASNGASCGAPELCQASAEPDFPLGRRGQAQFLGEWVLGGSWGWQGNWVDIHNAPTLVTLGVTSSEPCLPLPNVLLIASPLGPTESRPPGARAGAPLPLLLPLRYVRLSVQDSGRRLLRVQVVTGKVYYLRLHQAHPDAVFTLWSRLADILQWGLSITTKDPSIHVPHSLVLSVGSSQSGPSSSCCQEPEELSWCSWLPEGPPGPGLEQLPGEQERAPDWLLGLSQDKALS